MNAPSREEIDTRFALAESRTDAYVKTMMGQLDAMMARMEERDKRFQQQFDEQNKRFEQRFQSIERICADIKLDLKNLRTTTIVTAITATLATVFGVAAFNATVLSNMLASFDAGQKASSSHSELVHQMDAMNAKIERIDQRLGRMEGARK